MSIRLLVVAAVAVVAATLIPVPAAQAAEIRYPDSSARGAAVPALTPAEAKRVTKYLLQRLIGPAVSSSQAPPQLNGAWACRVPGSHQGRCRGAVRAGAVVCRGVFRVRKVAAGYTAYPLQMRCVTPGL